MMAVCVRGSPISLWAHVAECIISGANSDGATPSYNHSHNAVNQGTDKLTGMQQLTQQFNFGAGNSWNNWKDDREEKEIQCVLNGVALLAHF